MLHWRGRWAAAAVVAAAAAAAAAASVAVAVGVGGAVVLPRRPTPGGGAATAARLPPSTPPPDPVVVIPFPSPPPGPSAGRLHTLPALQCRPHPSSPAGGASPDPAAVVNPAGRGGTGWVLRAPPAAPPVVVPYGGGACASPLNDAFHLSYMATPAAARADLWPDVAGVANGSAALGGGADGGGDYVWAGNAFYAALSARAQWEPPRDHQIRSEYFRPLPCAAAAAPRPRTGLAVCEEEVARVLSLQRNQWVGRIDRQRGIYDVLAVGRATVGFVVDTAGEVVAAEDRVSLSAHSSGPRRTLVLHTAGDGVGRPVLAGDPALLTLGRAVLADPSWLGAAFPGGLGARIKLIGWNENRVGQPTRWTLRHDQGATHASRWLQAVAATLCAPPSTSFVAGDDLCNGVRRRKQSRHAPLLAGGRPVGASLGFAAGQHPSWSELGVKWTIGHPEEPLATLTCPALDGVTFQSATVMHPPWLFGRGDRELHTTGPPGGAEMELARNLSSCAFLATRADLSGNQQQFDGRGLTTHLSQRYRREIFQVDPPADPISNTELFLALLVVVPEAIAIVVLLLQQQRRGSQQRQQRRPRWYWREGSSAVLVAAAGVVALIGVGSLDAQEHAGHSWRAAALRYSRRIVANETEDRLVGTANVNYHGRQTTDNETLLLVARAGYRPHLTRRLLVVSTVVYAALTVAVLGKGAVTAWWRQRPRRGAPTAWRRPSAGDSAIEGAAGRPASSPAGAPPGGCDRHAPSRRMAMQPRGGATCGQTVKGGVGGDVDGVGGDGDGVGGRGSGSKPVGGPPAPAPAPASATGGRGLSPIPH